MHRPAAVLLTAATVTTHIRLRTTHSRDTMATTIGVLESEVEKSKEYVARVQSQDQRLASGQLDITP